MAPRSTASSRFSRDGSVTVFTGKVDLGTGLRIAVRQMAADELGLPVDRVDLVEGDTLLTPDQGRTGGSSGLTQGGVGVRQAAATAREHLIALGGGKAEPSRVRVEPRGRARCAPKPAARASQIATCRWQTSVALKVNPKVTLKDPADLCGRRQAPAPSRRPRKMHGHADLRARFQTAGHAARPRDPAAAEWARSCSRSMKRRSAGIPDVRIVRINDFLGVVAKSEWAAVRAAAALEAKWSDWAGLPDLRDSARLLRQGTVDHDETPVKRGDAAKAMPGAPNTFQRASTTRIRDTRRWAHPAPSPTGSRTGSRSGPVPNRRICSAPSSPRASICRRKRSG